MGVVRKTKSVNTLLDIFNSSNEAISVVKLVDQLSDQMNKTTIYRVLDRLDEDGVLHSFLGQDGVKWYSKCQDDCSTGHHHDVHPHFQCTDCGKTECLTVDVSIPIVPDRMVDSVQVLMVGTCHECSS